MTILAQDVIDGGGISQTSSGGASITRTFLISVDAGLSPDEKEKQAISECPVYGEGHPSIRGALCSGHRTEVVNPTTIRVGVEYTLPAAPINQTEPSTTAMPQITIGSTVVSTEVHEDRNGERLYVIYYPDASDGANWDYKYVLVEKMVPCSTFTCTRWEPYNPGPNSITYTGKLNATAILGCDSETLLCTALTGQSSDGGISYTVTYEFQYKPDGWKATIAYKDENNELPINHDEGLNVGSAMKDVDIYETAEFHNLFPLLP